MSPAVKEHDIDISLRKGSLRVSPHLYNTEHDIDALLEVLHAM